MLTLTHAPDTYKSIMSQSERNTKVLDWLCKLRLEQYMEAFQSAGMETLHECLNLTTNELERMGITRPGHQRRILTSLNNMHSVHDTEQTGHAEVMQKEVPVPVPVGGENLEGDKRDVETRRPTPCERRKPVPKQRCWSKTQKNSEEEVIKPIPGKRSSVLAEKKDDSNLETEEEKEKPIPKQRTKFCISSPLDCHSVSPVPSSSDTSLPPVPPRINNCPLQHFTTSQSLSPLSLHSGCLRTDQQSILTPPVLCRTLPSVSSSISTPVPTEAPFPIPSIQFTESRPQTLAIQPSALTISSVGGKQISPVSPGPSASEVKSIPPLPPKVLGPKGPPPIPQLQAPSPRTHR